MEIKIPKEVRLHKETVLFGLTLRQLLCSGLAVGTAVMVYLALGAGPGKGNGQLGLYPGCGAFCRGRIFSIQWPDVWAVPMGCPKIPGPVRRAQSVPGREPLLCCLVPKGEAL